MSTNINIGSGNGGTITLNAGMGSDTVTIGRGLPEPLPQRPLDRMTKSRKLAHQIAGNSPHVNVDILEDAIRVFCFSGILREGAWSYNELEDERVEDEAIRAERAARQLKQQTDE